MMTRLKRPTADFDPRRSVLNGEHFQVAYITNDIARAMEVFADRYGIANFVGQEGATPSGGQIHVELAWKGGVMFELIETSGPGSDFYNDRLPAEGFAIRHHHLGYMVWTEEEWDALHQKIADEGWPIAFQMRMEGYLYATYIHAPELGHYLEYIHPQAGGMAFFDSVSEG